MEILFITIWGLVGVVIFAMAGIFLARPEIKKKEREHIEYWKKQGWVLNDDGNFQKGDSIVKRDPKSWFDRWMEK